MPQASGALKEVLDYPLHAWSALCSAERAGVAARGSVDQLVANLQQGLEACSAYNGLGAWDLATCYTQHAGSILGLIGSDVVAVKHIEGCWMLACRHRRRRSSVAFMQWMRP